MKNPMSGNLSVLFHSIFAAQNPQTFKYRNHQVRSSGNPYAHAILRGGVDGNGMDVPNFHYEALAKIENLYHDSGLENPAVLVDCNHSNSGKKCGQQRSIALEVMDSRLADDKIKKVLKGFMIESFLVEGNQPAADVFGQSITDPCIGWEETEKLLQEIANRV